MSTRVSTFREAVHPSDCIRVEELARGTNVFRESEVKVARELVSEHLSVGEASGYFFLFADDEDGSLLGYACYGAIDGTVGSFDLFWIVVSPCEQGKGLGRALFSGVVARVQSVGGRKIVIETSSLPSYEKTRRFYHKLGCALEARISDFYDTGDDKLIFTFSLTETLFSP